MKKNEKKIATYAAQRDAKSKVLENLKGKLIGNFISDDARAEAEAVIAEKEAEITAIRDLIAELEADPEIDHTEQFMNRLKELTERIVNIENSVKGDRGFLEVANFIQSKEGEKAFMDVVKNSPDGKSFKKNWKDKLVQNGITPADVMLPPAIIQEINDQWETVANNFLSYLDVTGLVAYKALYDSSDPSTDTSRAQGHTKGNEKNEQIVPLVPREIRAQFIYKYITIDRETVEYEDQTGALMRFIARELAARVLHEIMRAVLVGDGRTAGTEGKIDKFIPVATDTAVYTTQFTSAGATPTLAEAAEAVDSIVADGAIIVAMSKATLRSLRSFVSAAGGTPQYKTMEQLADELGVAAIFVTRILEEADMPSLIAFVGKNYKVVGDLTMRGFENFILSYNKNEYLTEVYAGGALVVPKSAAVINTPATPEP